MSCYVSEPAVAWVDPGLTNGTTYYYVVSAANAFGTGPTSNVASVTPDGSLPLPVNAATFVSQSVPATMTPGQAYPVTVTMRNTGTSAWTGAGGYRLGSQSPQDNTTWGLSRVGLPGTPPAPVQPGATAAFTFTVTAPSSPGSYPFQWRMVQDGAAGGPQWFGDLTPLLGVAVSVTPPPFRVTNVSNGDVLSGDVILNVAVYSGDLNSDDITLYIDGQSIDSDNIQQQPDGSYAVSLAVYTNDYPNGAHQITVSDGQGNSDTRLVMFSNTVQNLLCGAIFDLSAGETDVPQDCHITADLNSSLPWQVAIQDYNGNTIKSYSGAGSSIDATWDGTNSQGAVADNATYDVIITTGTAGSSALTANLGVPPVRRKAIKSTIGDALVLIDQDDVVGAGPRAMQYAAFIENLLYTKIGTDFTSKIGINVMVTNGATMDKSPPLRSRINNQLRTKCRLIYVIAHGSSMSAPRFKIGNYLWYSDIPFGFPQSPSLVYFNVNNLTAGIGYGNIVDPPTLVWMDTCLSAGVNPTNPDFRWTNPFGIDLLNGYEGAFVGWAGNIGPYGYQAPNLFLYFTTWREKLWYSLFNSGQNIATAIANANNTPGQSTNPNVSPKGLVAWYGTDSSAF